MAELGRSWTDLWAELVLHLASEVQVEGRSLEDEVRNRKNLAVFASSSPITFAEMLSEIGSSTPIPLRLIHRQAIGISMVDAG